MKNYPFSTIALAILSLLKEAHFLGSGGMHVYRMQQLIQDRGKEDVINVKQRTSLYRTIERLMKVGLVQVDKKLQDSGKPERTVYHLTDKGHQVWEEWMLNSLSTPKNNFPEFPAAIAFLPLLTPQEVRVQLSKRLAQLEKELEHIHTGLAYEQHGVPRLFLLESSYMKAITDAEISWVKGIIKDLESGDLTWDKEFLTNAMKN
jgi:DNA-binding PadR family transcriptional regulator